MVTGQQYGAENWHWVMCLSCECNGPTKNATEEEAMASWNTKKGGADENDSQKEACESEAN